MTVEITVKQENPFLAKKIKNYLQELSNLKPEVLHKLSETAKNKPDVLEKLVEISENEKAISVFLENYEMIKNM